MGDTKIKFKVSDEQLEELYHKYCRDFTQLARAGRFDPITGRDEEIDQAILIILQKGRKNVALLAPAGVGKTALCAGLAQQIVAGNVPDYLKDARVMEVDLAAMSAGTTGPAEFRDDSCRCVKAWQSAIMIRPTPKLFCSLTRCTRLCRPAQGVRIKVSQRLLNLI